jgi:hypothetical protein
MADEHNMKSDGETKGVVAVGVADALVGGWINANPNSTSFTGLSITTGFLGLLTRTLGRPSGSAIARACR